MYDRNKNVKGRRQGESRANKVKENIECEHQR